MIQSFSRQMRSDCRGAAVLEFAILAPIFFAMLFGVVQVGLQMWSYNSLRSIAADTGRYTMVEYQKGNQLTPDQIESKAIALAVNSPYDFNIDHIDISAPTAIAAGDSDYIAGMTGYRLTMSYTPPTVLDFTGISAPTLTVTRPIYVTT
jgi:Flp pilus assembly protein TadG